MSDHLKQAVLRVASANPDFRQALIREIQADAKVGMRGRLLPPNRRSYLPADVQDLESITPPGTDLEIWKYELAGKIFAIAFAGKANRPLWHHRFRSEAERDRMIEKTVEDSKAKLVRKDQRKVERKVEREQARGSLVVGDILYSSWGYDQTNVDFYQVVGTTPTGSTVLLRSIAKKEVGPDKVIPVPDRFIGQPLKRRVGTRGVVKINNVSNAYKWHGKPVYQTPFGFGH